MLKVQLLKDGAKAPMVAHPNEDLGYDLFAAEDTYIYEFPTWVSTGIAVEDTEGHGFIVKDRSSMAGKGIFTHGGVIDAGYRGEIKINLTFNKKDGPFNSYKINAGDKIAQMIPVKPATSTVEVVAFINESERGTAGFGSTGV